MKQTTLDAIKDEVTELVNSRHDSQHNLEHLQKVTQNAFELAQKHEVDLNLLEAICYVHDLTYVFYSPGPKTYLLEGKYIKKILKDFLAKYDIDEIEKEVIINACSKHPLSFPFKKLNRKEDVYTQILQDADTIDYFRPERIRSLLKNKFLADTTIKLYEKAKDRISYHFLNLYAGQDTRKYIEWNSGNKDILVLLHGYADNAELFTPLIPLFPKHRLISINFPMNHLQNKIYSVEELADYALAVLSDLEIQSYYLIGFSLGGMVATEIASRDARVKKLVLLNSFPSLSEHLPFKKTLNKSLKVVKNKPGLWLYSRINTNTVLKKLLSHEKLSIYKKRLMRTKYYNVFGTLLNCLFYDGLKKYSELAIPKIVILTQDDLLVPFKRYMKLANANDMQVAAIKSGGHNLGNDYWENIGIALKSFI